MTQTEPQFKIGDRCFSHYTMQWGTIESISETVRGQTHGLTGSPLPDTTWYKVLGDDNHTDLLDDAHGDWEMARIVPPHIAKKYGYGDDPKAPKTEPDRRPGLFDLRRELGRAPTAQEWQDARRNR